MPIKTTLSDEIHIAELYRGGKTQKEICELLNAGRKRIKSALVRQGVRFRDKSETANKIKKTGEAHPHSIPLPKQDVIDMYESGMSAYEVADHFGVSEGVIRYRLRLWGEHIRDYGESTTVRFDRMTEAERIEHGRLTSEALKGKTHSYEHRCALAKAREINITHVGRGEKQVGQILSDHGFNITPQKAVGKYNVDIAINKHRIAVEVFTGMSWLTSSGKRCSEKFKYLVNSGWKPVIVCFSNGQPEVVKIKNNLIACLDILCLDRPTVCHYPVIWCKRKSVATVYADVEDWPAVLRSYRTQNTGC